MIELETYEVEVEGHDADGERVFWVGRVPAASSLEALGIADKIVREQHGMTYCDASTARDA